MVSEFDIAAATYDAEFSRSSIGKAQRERVYHYLNRWLPAALNILEVNCGTGIDAVYLAKKGHRVTATDASEAMLKRGQEKGAGLDIRFASLDLRDLAQPWLETTYDLVFSNFGGLNCLHPAEFGRFMEQAANLLSEGGQLILVLMSRSCLLEDVYYRLKGQPKEAKRRHDGGPLEVNVNGVDVPTWYYNPKDVEALLPAGLKIQAAHPIGISIPPSYMQQGIDKQPWLLKLGAALEPILSLPAFASRGDHFILKIVRK